jgi:ribonuclease HI
VGHSLAYPAFGLREGVQDVARAELIALREAISAACEAWKGREGSREDATIYLFTDSSAIMSGLKNYIKYPNSMKLHPYVHTFAEIVKIVQQSGLRFRIHKVKAHAAGVEGNDIADYIAKDIWKNDRNKADEGDEPRSTSTEFEWGDQTVLHEWREVKNVDEFPAGVCITLPINVHSTILIGGTPLTSDTLQARMDSADGEQPRRTAVYNIKTNLKKFYKFFTSIRLPTPNRWRERLQSGEVDPNPPSWLLSQSSAMRTLLLRLCHKQFFTQQTANMFAQHELVSEFCPICGKETDSWGHTLLTCSHTRIAILHLARHQEAVVKLFRELQRQENSPPRIILADISSELLNKVAAWDDWWEDETELEEETGREGETILSMDYDEIGEEEEDDPSYAPPKGWQEQIVQEQRRDGNPEAAPAGHSMRKHMRHILGIPPHAVRRNAPDIIVAEGWTETERIPQSQRKNIKINIIEFTYASENSESYERAYTRKMEAYTPLCKTLVKLGYPRPDLTILVGGVRGWHMHKTRTTLQSLKFDTRATQRIRRAWTMSAWHYAQTIIRTRRWLEFTEEFRFKSGLARWNEFKAFDIIRKRKSRRK